MKTLYNFFVLVLVITGAYSCSTSKEEKLIKEAEHYFEEEVLPKFNDPKSYEKVSTSITDTFFTLELAKEQLNEELSVIEIQKRTYKLYENSVLYSDEDLKREQLDINATQFKIDSLNEIINSTDKNLIGYIDMIHTFRAKIPLGGLMLGNYTIRYHVVGDDGFFEILNEKDVSF